MAINHHRNPILGHRIGTADRRGHLCHFQRSGGATLIQPIKYPKAVWIDNMVATRGAFHHWALGMHICNVDGGIFPNIIIVDPRNLGRVKSRHNPPPCHRPARCRRGKCGFNRAAHYPEPSTTDQPPNIGRRRGIDHRPHQRRLARNNLDVHVQIMQILVSYINANAIVLRSVSPTTRSSPAPFTSSNT